MPGYFKKRKTFHGPNKNEQKVIRAEAAKRAERRAGVLSDKFPTVKRLSLQLSFLDHDRLIDEQVMALDPGHALALSLPCPGRCGRGSLDLTEKLSAMIEARTESAQDALSCVLPLYAGSAQTCGCEARWRAQVEYFPIEAPADAPDPAPEEPAPQA